MEAHPTVSVIAAGKVMPATNALLQAAGNAVEGRRQAGADGGHAGNDNDSNESSDQAILDGGGAGLILAKAEKDITHDGTPLEIAATLTVGDFQSPYDSH